MQKHSSLQVDLKEQSFQKTMVADYFDWRYNNINKRLYKGKQLTSSDDLHQRSRCMDILLQVHQGCKLCFCEDYALSMKINRWWFVTVVSVLCAAFFSTSTSQNVEPPPLVYLGSNSQGAVCLDGSSPAYSIDPGSGSGQNSWIVHLEGGGWCGSLDDCLQRSLTDLGSSKYMTAYGFGGFLSNSPSVNPGFYNWNRVLVRYCDGGSFAGNADSGVQVTSNGGTTTLYFRGQAVWEAVIDDLLTKGLASADKAILSGDSAGGSAAFFQCNRFKEKLSSQTDVKCLCDAGFFMDIPNLAGEYSFREFFQYVVTLHQITLLPSGCTSQMSLGQCYFPEYNLAYINVPLFFVQSPYDNFQVRYILAPPSSYSNGSWDACKQDLASCSSSQISTIQDQLSGVMLKALSPLVGSQNWGMYMASCYYHTEVTDDTLWNGMTTVSGLNLAQAFSSWYFQENLVQEIDCPYPCNPTCISS